MMINQIINIINVWRERLPHQSEDLHVWRKLLNLRNSLFLKIKGKLIPFLEELKLIPKYSDLHSEQMAELNVLSDKN